VMDRILARAREPLVFRAGSHEEVMEMTPEEFIRLEQPRLADFAVTAPALPRFEEGETWAW
jgi:hypothetical protein